RGESIAAGGSTGLGNAKAFEKVEIGDEVGLLVLFDGPAARAEPPFLEFGPGTVGNTDDPDWSETERIALALVLQILAAQLALHGVGQALWRAGDGQVVLLDEQRVIGRIVPGGDKQIRLETKAERPLGGLHGGDDLMFGELLAGQARVMSPLVQEFD